MKRIENDAFYEYIKRYDPDMITAGAGVIAEVLATGSESIGGFLRS